MGDFYETFDADAELVSEVLDIALTSREMGRGGRIPMAGIPHHSADNYLSKLLAAGHRVAIAEQVSEPTGRGIVDRQVTSIITPGTVTNPELLRDVGNSFVCALISDGDETGLALADATTGEFATTTLRAGSRSATLDHVRRELLRLTPLEVIAQEGEVALEVVSDGITRSHTDLLNWRLDEATSTLLEHFGVISLEAFGCDRQPLATRAAGALLAYLQRTQLNRLNQIAALYTYAIDQHMSLDAQTRLNLELEESLSRPDNPTLFSTINATLTAVGNRLLHRWLGQPLLSREQIEARYDGVDWFADNAFLRAGVRDTLRGMPDIERTINRVANRQAGPREVARLGEGLQRLPDLAAAIDVVGRPAIVQELPDCADVAQEIASAIADEAPTYLGQGDAIRPGYSSELDSLREVLRRDRNYIAGLEERERQETGIERMKVGFNKVFGYYLEISNANRIPVPEHYIRKQTLVNAERYITPELKEAEQRVSSAEERIQAAEEAAFQQLVTTVGASAPTIRRASEVVAVIDALAGLAEIAANRGYVRPIIVDEDLLEIKAGRHPIVEREMSGGQFVANDVGFGTSDGHIAIITGPNMAGKSTYLRQTALIVLLAQMGSFVPADQMKFSIVDRIFTRIGAQDDLASGQSTFMVEMLETATILNHATNRSLVILDEIGRGTSTYDGLAIATAIVEYLHNTPRLGSKTMFATHYHELTTLAEILPKIRNYRVDILESGADITFLYRVVPGGADRSYGIYVAELAGMPRGVIRRAEDILSDLEHNSVGNQREQRIEAITNQPLQMTLFGATHPALKQLAELEIDALSPLEALTRLYELKSLLEDAD